MPQSPHLAQTLLGLATFHLGQGEHRTAQAIGRQLLRLAEQLADPGALLHAHGLLGIVALYVGEFVPGSVHLEHGITLAEHGASSPLALSLPWDMGVVCLMGLASSLQQLGYADQAYHWSQEALRQAQSLASPFNRCNLLFFLACLHLFRREWAIAQQVVQTSLSLATAHGFPLYEALGSIVQGATAVAQGHGQEGAVTIRQGLAALRTMGTQLLHPWGLAMLAEGYARLGQPEAGLAALAEAQALMATTDETCYAAEIARLQGALLMQANGQAVDGHDGLASTASA